MILASLAVKWQGIGPYHFGMTILTPLKLSVRAHLEDKLCWSWPCPVEDLALTLTLNAVASGTVRNLDNGCVLSELMFPLCFNMYQTCLGLEDALSTNFCS